MFMFYYINTKLTFIVFFNSILLSNTTLDAKNIEKAGIKKEAKHKQNISKTKAKYKEKIKINIVFFFKSILLPPPMLLSDIY